MRQNDYCSPDGVTTRAVSFACHGAALVGIAHLPAAKARAGVVVVVGGPQYRVGSHRQFVELARHLAGRGVAVLRFDHRGIGDSQGDPRPFYALNDDLRGAVNCLAEQCDGLDHIILWGLCDGAAASLLYANRDDRVSGLVLANPWLDSQQDRARSVLTHYYRQRLRSSAFWRRLFKGEVAVGRTLRELLASTYLALGGVRPAAVHGQTDGDGPALSEILAAELGKFRRPVLTILSGDDLTAAAFRSATRTSAAWKKSLAAPGVTLRDVKGADHSFSDPSHARAVCEITADWIVREVAEG